MKGAGIREVEDTAMNHSLPVSDEHAGVGADDGDVVLGVAAAEERLVIAPSDEQFERWTAQLKARLAELEG